MENPSYFSILTADVRYDKELKANEKLLYSEISSLTNKSGYCTARNKYFAQLYDVHKDTISDWISNLKNKKYITVETVRSGKKVAERRIYLTDTCRRNDLQVIGENTYNLVGENTLENNINNNNINIIIYSRVIDYLNLKANKNFKASTKKTQDLIKARLNEHFTENDFRKVIDTKAAEWKNDSKMQKYLRPETLFGTKFESYLNENQETNSETIYNTDFSEYDQFDRRYADEYTT